MDVDHIRLGIEVIIPDMLKQHGAGDDLAGVLHQIFEQPKLARLEDDLLAAARYFMGETIEREIADTVYGFLGRPAGFRRASVSTLARSSEKAYGFDR